MPFIVYAAEPEDADLLANIRVQSMRESLEALGRFDPERARERFLNSFVSEETYKLVSGQQILGFYVLRDRTDHIWLDHLYIHPGAQGDGIGAAVISRIKAHAFSKGKPIRLGALKQSKANAFYQHHGFQRTHSEDFDNYYEFTPEPAYQLETTSQEDFEELQHIRYTAMKESAEANGLFQHDKASEIFLSEYAPEKTRKILRNGKTIGFYVVLNHPDHMYLDMFYLLPEAQGLGIGSKILQQIKTQADEQNKPIRLDALRISRANDFYQCYGFRVTHSEGSNNYYEYMPKCSLEVREA